MPAWGRASGEFSILTDSAGRVSTPPLGSGRPVSGAVGGGSVVVVLLLVVGAGRFFGRATGAASSEHAAAPARSIAVAASAARWRPINSKPAR
jgi:hypothetical protein